MRKSLAVVGVLCVALLLGTTTPARGADPVDCSHQLAAHEQMTPDAHHACVEAIVTTYLDAQTNSAPPSSILLTGDALRYQLGPKPNHASDGAATIRSSYPTDITRIANEEWVVDGDVAYVSYDAFTKASPDKRALVVTDRFTLRDGLIWEILTIAAPPVSDDTAAKPAQSGVIVFGTPADNADHSAVNLDDGQFCARTIGDGTALDPDQRKQCNTAIASTYINSEQNTAPGWEILVDPMAVNISAGQTPVHRTGGGDVIRGRQGVTGPNLVISKITNRDWSWDGDTGWIRYDGFTRGTLDKPDYFVVERFKLRHGLIWELMVPAIAYCPAGTTGNCVIANL